ncbi:GTPase domain-containing protein [Hydrogenophaga atypica]|uniref:GTPase domain-containing protein n=1 Tax=Hydrogenophaga atypica TaxID=249409 RepID=A0ABW2QEA0_9BURK
MTLPEIRVDARIEAEAAASPQAHTLALCLVSHTNVGKTTLTRTLLGADVGEVRDAAHVTQHAEAHTLLQTEAGDRLVWWDTPGLGDSARLYRRLSQSGNPLGWFLSQVWDRWTDPAFFLSQRAMRSARDDADVLLYLVNASEAPQDAGYLAHELKILAWMGKPVLVLLNQLGPAGDADQQAAEVARWQRHLATFAVVRGVLPLDAFSRCWVQEEALFEALAPCLPDHVQASHQRLLDRWWQAQLLRFQASMAAMAPALLRATEVMRGAPDQAQAALARHVAGCQQSFTRVLLDQHGLHGEAGRPHWQALAQSLLQVRVPVSKAQAGWLGAISSGAATGLGADLMAGGLSMGAGALIGALAGAATFAGAALAANRLRGVDVPEARLSVEAWRELVEVALCTYLAVAHFGRGRGAFVDEGAPALWQQVVGGLVAQRADELAALWAAPQDPQASHQLAGLLEGLALRALKQLYPAMDLGRAQRGLAALSPPAS